MCFKGLYLKNGMEGGRAVTMVGVGMIREDMLNTRVGRKREREGEKHITRREKEQERGRESWGGGVVLGERERETEK